MQCLEVKELLSPYLDGELSPQEGESISDHLAVCPDCRSEWLALCETVDVFKNLPEIAPPPEFRAQVINQIKSLSRMERKETGFTRLLRSLAQGRWSRGAALAATVLLTAGITVLMYGAPGQWLNKGFLPRTAYVQMDEPAGGGQGGVNSDGPGFTNKTPVNQPSGYDQTAVNNQPPDSVEPGAVSPGQPSEQPGSGSPDNYYSRQLQQLNSLLEEQSNGGGLSAPSSRIVTAPQTMAVKEGAISQQTAFGYLPVSNLESRKLIRSATFNLTADDMSGAPAKLVDIAGGNGGYLVTGDAGGTITMKVPAEQFKQVIDLIKGLGSATLRQIVGEDVTERYYDYEARLRDLSAEEQRLLAVIDSTGTVNTPDAQAAQSKLALIRIDLERQKKLLRDLSDKVQYAVIRINLE